MRPINRLGSGRAIRQIYATGRKFRTATAAIATLIEGSLPPQVAVVASRRIGNAVQRSKARRRLRAAVHPLISQISPGVMAVLTATKSTASSNFQNLEQDVVRCFERTGALRPTHG